ncbi:hypothetical protein BD560DRAFT_394888 [Blakeslea trispora]|nr:hypothetical protein BD560DRAFT_394888 [Blakeslea trispora]
MKHGISIIFTNLFGIKTLLCFRILYSQTSTFDIHLLTISRQAEQRRRTIKSWFNLTNTNSSFDVQVTDDWFPTPLPSGSSNLTWTVYVFLLGRDRKLDPTSNDINLTTTAYVELQVVQSSPIPIVIDRDIFSHQWIIVIVMVSSFLAIAATCIIVWLYKNMQKHKKQQERQEQQQKEKIILSAPDAMMIANKFRQVMSNSELLNQQHIQVGEDLLKRQLASEHNMSVSEVERRTSSFSRKTACS